MNLKQRIIALQNEINRVNAIMYGFRDTHITNHTCVVIRALQIRINAMQSVLDGHGNDDDKIIARNEMEGRGQSNMSVIIDLLENR